MIENAENLREQVMISQFEMATGCTKEQSRQILQASRWEYLTALSMFFQDNSVVGPTTGYHQHHRYPITGHVNTVCAPCNTPATPPSFPETLMALQKMQASDWSSPSPMGSASGTPINCSGQFNGYNNAINIASSNFVSSPHQALFQQQTVPKVLSPFNPMPPPCDKLQHTMLDWSMTGNEMGSKINRSGTMSDSGENQQQPPPAPAQQACNHNNNNNLLFPIEAHY